MNAVKALMAVVTVTIATRAAFAGDCCCPDCGMKTCQPTREEKIQRREARLRAIEREEDLNAAVNVEGLPPHKRRRHNEKVIDLDVEKRQVKKDVEGLRKLGV